MGQMVYPVLSADGVLVAESVNNGRSVIHSLTIFNDDAAPVLFQVKQGGAGGTVIWQTTIPADTSMHFYFPVPLEGVAPNGSNAGDLYMDTAGTTVTISGICEQGIIPSG